MSEITTTNEWQEPKTNYVAGDDVLPEIFNKLGINEKYLKEILANIVLQKLDASKTILNSIVLVEVADNNG